MLSRWHSEDQNFEMNSFPRSETISWGVLCLVNTCFKNSVANSMAPSVLQHSMKITYFVSLSTITRIESKSKDRGNPLMKSIEMELHGCCRIGKNFISPYGLCRTVFVLVHSEHEWT